MSKFYGTDTNTEHLIPLSKRLKSEQEKIVRENQKFSPLELENLLYQALRPGLLLIKTPRADSVGSPGCWLGGQPTLPAEIDWPTYSCGDYVIPMHFVAQLNLSSIPRMPGHSEMPTTGTLFFFFDPICAPLMNLAEGGSKVIYVEDEVSSNIIRTMPTVPKMDDMYYCSTYDKNSNNLYRRWNVNFSYIEFVDTGSNENASLNKISKQHVDNQLSKLKKIYLEKTKDDTSIKFKESFAIHSMYARLTSINSPNELLPLLEISIDPNIEFNFYSSIVFWIDEYQLKKGNFEQVICLEG